MDIKILGVDDKEIRELRNRVLEAILSIDSNVTITIINDKEVMVNQYKIKKKIGLIINNDYTIEGRMITARELSKILKKIEKEV